MLADAKHHRQERHQQSCDGADCERAEHAEPEVAGEVGGGEADHRAQKHDALDAEIQDTGALRIELAERGEDQRRRDAEQRCEEAHVEEGGEDVHLHLSGHNAIPLPVAGRG